VGINACNRRSANDHSRSRSTKLMRLVLRDALRRQVPGVTPRRTLNPGHHDHRRPNGSRTPGHTNLNKASNTP
jgi:hypothetical protein